MSANEGLDVSPQKTPRPGRRVQILEDGKPTQDLNRKGHKPPCVHSQGLLLLLASRQLAFIENSNLSLPHSVLSENYRRHLHPPRKQGCTGEDPLLAAQGAQFISTDKVRPKFNSHTVFSSSFPRSNAPVFLVSPTPNSPSEAAIGVDSNC